MKAKLEFDLELEKPEFENALNGRSAFAALDEIRNQVFRPARKHGYQEEEITKLIEQNPELCNELVGKLEELFYEILEEYEVKLG